jgi:4-amino-4-deoxy-L-arabinose transferase-like glycosyltransferase
LNRQSGDGLDDTAITGSIVRQGPILRRSILESGDARSIVVLVIVTLASCLPLLVKYPSPGGDEPGFVDVAYTVATRGSISTDVYPGLLPGADHHIYWQPPLYFLTLGGWFRAFGASLTTARSFSLLWAIVTVVLVYLTARRNGSQAPSMIAAILFAVSFWLTNRASIARMDMMCIALTMASVFIYLIARERHSLTLHGLSGLIAGLALTTHPLGVVAIATVAGHEALSDGVGVLRSRRTFALLGGFAVAAAAWGAYVAEDPATFSAQMARQLERKSQHGSYWDQFSMAKTHALTLGAACGAGFWLVVSSWRTRTRAVIAIAFAISFGVATFGRETGYLSYFYPFACIALAMALSAAGPWRRTLTVIVSLALLNEALILVNDIRRYRHRDYDMLSRTVLDAIPRDATVFIAHPAVTPYFALLGRNPMRVAVPTPTEPQAHRKVALASDYIAVTTPLVYLPDVNELLSGLTPVAVVDQGPGYSLELYRSPGAGAKQD